MLKKTSVMVDFSASGEVGNDATSGGKVQIPVRQKDITFALRGKKILCKKNALLTLVPKKQVWE